MPKEPVTSFEVHPLTPERWSDLRALFGERGACAGCWCMWWRVPPAVFRAQQGSANHQALKGLVDSGVIPGLLGYVDGLPSAWCAVGPREHFPNLERSRTLKRVDARPVWSIVCFFVSPRHRRRGLTPELLRAAAAFAYSRGARIIEGYPLWHDPGTPSSRSYMGGLGAFLAAGFVEVAQTSKVRRIVRRYLDSEPGSG